MGVSEEVSTSFRLPKRNESRGEKAPSGSTLEFQRLFAARETGT